MKRGNQQKLWVHICYMSEWSNRFPIGLVDVLGSKKITERLMVMLGSLYPIWASMQTEDSIVNNFTIAIQPLKVTLSGEEDE